MLIVAAVRFVRTERLLADPQIHPIAGVRVEVILSAILALIVAVLGALLALAGLARISSNDGGVSKRADSPYR